MKNSSLEIWLLFTLFIWIFYYDKYMTNMEWEFIILSLIPPSLNDNTTTQQLLLSNFE